MGKIILLTLFTTFLSLVSCSKKLDYELPDLDVHALEIDHQKWLSYHNENISYASPFIALDDSLNIISKGEFIKTLTNAEHIPIKLKSNTSSTYYKLHKLSKDAKTDIIISMISTIHFVYDNFKMEEKPFPDFNFTDLSKNLYSNDNTKGKILVVKAWFINCPPCIKEFPELNDFVDKHQQREDVTFLSIALDSKDDLNQFLSRTPFNYPVIADQTQLIREDLKLRQFPTHFIIDKNGIIKQVTNSAKEMISILEKDYFTI